MTEKDKILRRDFILSLIEKYGDDRTYLLPILQEIQKRFLYIVHFNIYLLKTKIVHFIGESSLFIIL